MDLITFCGFMIFVYIVQNLILSLKILDDSAKRGGQPTSELLP